MERSNRKVQYWVTLAVSLATMTSSASFSWSTPVIPKFHSNETNIAISESEISWVVASPSPGAMVGCLLTPYEADKLGRRVTLLGSALPFIIGTVFIVTATKAWMLYLARFLWGIGAGIISSVSLIYIAEIADKDIRGSLSVGNRFFFNFGGFLMLAAGSFMSYQTLSCLLIVLPVCFFVACWFIPESPYYLLKEGKVDAARKALVTLNGYTDEKVLEDRLSEMKSHVRQEMERSGTLKELFTGRQYRKAIIISVGLRLTQVLAGTVPIQQYLGRIMQETHSSISVSAGLIVFGAIRFATGILSSVIVDRVGRRPLLICSYIGTSLSLATVGAYFFLDEVIGTTPSYYSTSILIGIIVSSIISTLGFEILAFVIPAEIFPINVKSIAMMSANLFSSVIVFVNLRGYQLIKDLTGLYGVFWFFGAMALTGAVFSYVAVPETKGKSLMEIQTQLQKHLDSGANGTSSRVDHVKSGTQLDCVQNREVEALVKS